MNSTMRPTRRTLVLAALLIATGCGRDKKSADGGKNAGNAIQNIGSDTMVNLAQAWAEEYAKVVPGVSVEVSGGGSGVGVAALINGTADIANSSRKLEPEEVDKAKKHSGTEPREYTVGYDGLAIYVHKDNPLEEISLADLSEIYREGGSIDKWSQLGVNAIPSAQGEEIIRVSRQNNSGTYHYFREVVVGKKADMRQGSLDMSGSKDVVELVSKTPGAIGYSGVGYATSGVKILRVSRAKGEPGVTPTIDTVLDKSYPISRPMFMYTPGEPPAHVSAYIEWVMSDAGQKVVIATGYVPLKKG